MWQTGGKETTVRLLLWPRLSLKSLTGSWNLKKVFEITLRGHLWIHANWTPMSPCSCSTWLSVIITDYQVYSPQWLNQAISTSVKCGPREMSASYELPWFLVVHLKTLLQPHSLFHIKSLLSLSHDLFLPSYLREKGSSIAIFPKTKLTPFIIISITF